MNYALAKEVKARILAEPKLVNMQYFCESANSIKQGFCGSVGCIAGHAALASGIKPKTIKVMELNMDKLGQALLEISKKEAHQLFYFYDDDKHVANGDEAEEDCPYLQFARRLRKQRAGSQRYAKIVADALDHCVLRHHNCLELRDEA